MLPASNIVRRRGVLRRSTWSMDFVRILHRFLELLEIGPMDFDIRSPDCSLLFVCGLGWADGHRKIVLVGAGRFSRSVSVVGFRGVGPFVASSWYFQGPGTFLSTPYVPGTQFGS